MKLGFFCSIAIVLSCSPPATQPQAHGPQREAAAEPAAQPGATAAESASQEWDDSLFKKKKVFVTSTKYTGDLKTLGGGATGLEGADNLCKLAAEGAGIGGEWRAWLATDSVSAYDRFKDGGPWHLVDGTLIFNNTKHMRTSLQHPINIDEFGNEVKTTYWTGARHFSLGPLNPEEPIANCNNWTSSDSTICGVWELSSVTNSTWAGDQNSCSRFSVRSDTDPSKQRDSPGAARTLDPRKLLESCSAPRSLLCFELYR
jgi:hypothetical protein